MVEQYSEYSNSANDDYTQSEELPTSSQSGLYSISHPRVMTGSTSYSSLGATDTGYVTEQNSNTTASVPNSSVESNSTVSSTNGSLQNSGTNNNTLCVYLHSRTALMMEIEDAYWPNCKALMQAIINCDELGFNKQLLTSQIFAIWMTSPLLSMQLKPSQNPYEIRLVWQYLLDQYSTATYIRKKRDEPRVMFKRNVFYPQYMEEKIKDQKILELLYEEARDNILQARYPCERYQYIMLGGIQARIELGNYNPQIHTTHYFREEQYKYLPMHVRKSDKWIWLPISAKNSAETKLLEQFKRIPASATNRKLMRKYLEFCWSLPFYGSAFFDGQIEQPVRGLTSYMTQQDIPVLIAINTTGVFIIDDLQTTVLLGLTFQELSWEIARPSKEDNPNCLPCLFLQFMTVENGAPVSKILQVFSKQASLIDILISSFMAQTKNKSNEDAEKSLENQLNHENVNHSALSLQSVQDVGSNPTLANKLSNLTLATFDENGRCIGTMGSWSFSFK